ncbi:N-acetyl-gamma-glutamyl-phosphate reductase [bacterium]|nr:MAG: N-acetyl-gamma-glutamyl-phosphate reductase [bacterium]
MTSTSSVRVGIIGASGYTGSELARLLATHPNARLTVATASGERVGQRMSDLFPSLRGVCDLELELLDFDALAEKCDVVVLAMGHGKALDLAAPLLERGLRVIDLGADFRLRSTDEYKEWYHLDHSAPQALAEAVYGLVEWNREKIKEARLVANPGCYPTSAILALSPFVAANAIKADSIIVDSASGVSGAGRASFGVGTHFPEHFGDFRAYNVTTHRHTPEIEQGLGDAAPGQKALVTFTAHLLPVARGILSTCYATPSKELSAEEAHSILAERYANEHFVRVLPLGQWPSIKAVNGSNFCDIACSVDKRTGRLIVVSALDNLIKGASGQVVQNLNVMYGFEENAGLQSAAVFP